MDKSIRNFVEGPQADESEKRKAVDATKMVTLYCYDTLSDSDCYMTPQPNQTTRLIGVTKKIMPYEQARLLAMRPEPVPPPKIKPEPEPAYGGPIPKIKPKSPPEPDRDISIDIGGKTYSSKQMPSDEQLKDMEQKEWSKLKKDNDKIWLEEDASQINKPKEGITKGSDFFVQKPPEPAADASKPADSPAPADDGGEPLKLQPMPQ